MRIGLNKPTPDRPRHVVLSMTLQESIDAGPVIGDVLGKGVRPVREFNKAKSAVKYRFHLRYLDALMLAFPMAEKSPGLQKRLDRASSRELLERTVPEFDIPGLWDRKNDCAVKPFNYQAIAIYEMIRYLQGEMDFQEGENFVNHFLQNDEMGLGKTFMALAALLHLLDINPDLKILVIAPKNGKFVWERENARWAGLDLVVVDADRQTPAKRMLAVQDAHTITVINPEMVRGTTPRGRRRGEFTPNLPALFEREYDIVIVDEYHRFGNPDSQQTKGLLHLLGKRWLPMSGTPYLTRPEQLWPVLHRCWPSRFPDYYTFLKAISIVQESRFGAHTVGYRPKEMAVVKKFIDARSIRRRKDQVLADLPKVHIIQAPVELTREQRRLYNQIRDNFLMELDDGSTKSITQIRTQVMRLKQACFSPELYGGSKHSGKIDELKEAVEQLVASGEKAIVFSEWSKATRILQRELAKYNPAYVDGTITGKKRMEQADKFNLDPDCHLYIGTIGANREAVTLSAATHVIFTDKDWSPAANDQAAARSAAGGLRGMDAKVDQVTRLELTAIDTYEDRVETMLAQRAAMFNAMVERDGGAKVARSMITDIRQLI